MQCEAKKPSCEPHKCKCNHKECIRRGYDRCVGTYCCGSTCEYHCEFEGPCPNANCSCDESYCNSLGKVCGSPACKDGQCKPRCKSPCKQMCQQYCHCDSDALCGYKAKCESASCDKENSCQFICNGTNYIDTRQILHDLELTKIEEKQRHTVHWIKRTRKPRSNRKLMDFNRRH